MSDFSPQAEMSDIQLAPTKAARRQQARRDNTATRFLLVSEYTKPPRLGGLFWPFW